MPNPTSRRRSQSLSDAISHNHDSAQGETTIAEAINSLRSFQAIWEERQKRVKNQPQKSDLESSPVGDGYIFPFYHLDFSKLTFHKNSTSERSSTFGARRTGTTHRHSNWNSPRDFPLNQLTNMIGLDDVKKEFLSAGERVQAAPVRHGKNLIRGLNLDLIITGNPGTGKSTIARLYAGYLAFLGVASISRPAREPYWRRYRSRYSSSDSSSDSSSGYSSDSSSDSSSCHSSNQTNGSNEVFIMDKNIDDNRLNSKQGVFVVVGSREEVKNILSHPKARGRFSHWIHLKDYSDEELLVVLVKMLKEKSLKVEGGFEAPFLRMFVRKIGYRRGQKDFQNIKTLQKELKKVLNRRAERLEKAANKNNTAIVRISYLSYQLTEFDFFGVKPTEFYEKSQAWKDLEKMAGFEEVKEAVKELVLRRSVNYEREIEGKEPLKVSSNRVFLGPPGTGKTTVATLFGKIIADLGHVESGEVVIKRPTDFLGQYVGHSEAQTKEILKDTKGKVLIIDEAHMFYHSSDHGSDRSDVFRQGIVDTIVAHVDNEPGNNRCIILMGYTDRMKEFYRNTNPGFQRRFPLEDAFVFENYDDQTLRNILDIMLTKDNITATNDAKEVAMEVLRRERDRPNFGNGGAVRNLVSRAQVLYSKRIKLSARLNQRPGIRIALSKVEATQVVLEPQDFDPEYDRGRHVNKDFSSLLKNLIGFKATFTIFANYQRMAVNMREHGLDPREEIPFSYVFKGPPGTGKTTTARALGQMYHTMGFLSTPEVLDCSVTDLVGTGQGITGVKVQNLLDRALGKVLFIDEAYRLGQKDLAGAFISKFAVEALGELVDCMTKERYAYKLVIVLAGYEKDMDALMRVNEGLRGRFTEIIFPSMKPKDCLRLLQKRLIEKRIQILSPRKDAMRRVIRLFEKLTETEAWANARDVETLSKKVVHGVFIKDMRVSEQIEISLDEVTVVLKQLLEERRSVEQMEESFDV